MKKILAVSMVDFHRLGFGLLSAALVAGLIPSLASGLGGSVPIASILVVAFIVVGITSGGSFGGDFAEGKGSFFFARPLSSGALIAGRFVAMLAFTVAVFAAVMASNWISTGDRRTWRLSVLNLYHAQALATSWGLSLFFALGLSAQGREPKSKWGPRDFALFPFRLAFSLVAGLLPFGLFADLVMRAYSTPTPAKIFAASFVFASFAASCLAIMVGRADRMRIARFLNLGMGAYWVLAFLVVVGAWAYVLHPGPGAIERVSGAVGSPDGRTAFVSTLVDRGDPKQFHPIFALDIGSGLLRRVNTDEFHGPWTSDDGGTMVWSEATPFLFRPLWRFLGGASSFRVRSPSGEVRPLPLPIKLPNSFSGIERTTGLGVVEHVLPSPDGDVFAIQWGRHLTFTSRSRGELSDVDFRAEWARVTARTFLPSGDLRAATLRRPTSAFKVEFADFDPTTASAKLLGSLEVGNNSHVWFDENASRALVSSQPRAGRTTISLVDLGTATGVIRATVLVFESINPSAVFLKDGRIAAMAGGLDHGPLRIFSPTGVPLRDIPVPDGLAFLWRVEMFPGVVPVTVSGATSSSTLELLFVEATTGAVLRRLSGYNPIQHSYPPYQQTGTPLPGSAAARLLHDGQRLYELPFLTSDPRLLAPLPRQ